MFRQLALLLVVAGACAPPAPAFGGMAAAPMAAPPESPFAPKPGGLEVPYSEAVAALSPVCNANCLVPLVAVDNPGGASVAGRMGRPMVLHHDPDKLRAIGAKYGKAAVVGVFAHELGHAHHIRDGLELKPHDAELYADMWAGCALRRLGYDTAPLEGFLLATKGGDTHPEGPERVEAVRHGHASCG